MVEKNKIDTESSKDDFVFSATSYRLMLVSIAVVCIGFINLIGKTDIYDFRKTVLAPLVVLSGFALGFVAILKKS